MPRASPRSGGPRSGGVDAAFTAADWGLFLGIGAIWGSSFLLIDVGLDAFGPGLVTFARVASGAAVLAVFPAARRPIDRSDQRRLVLLSVVWVALPFTLFPIAEQHVSSAVAGMLNGAMPLVATVVAAVMVRHRPGPAEIVGLVVGLAGVIAISVAQGGAGDSAVFGVALVLAATASYGYAVNVAAPLQARYGSLTLMGRMLGLATIWTAPYGLWSLRDSHFEATSAVAVAALGAVGTGVAFLVMGALVGRVGSTRASFITYVIPVVALVLGVAVRDDHVRPAAVVGVGLVVVGAFAVSRANGPRQPRASRTASTSSP